GRIAEVSVHTIPFPDDAVAPASKIKSELDGFVQSVATDCFLTAQVIGHVDKNEISGRETTDIHRLARARADTIQASLIDNGLPANSIASVWDWRFMVKEPRVTLWVFRLTAGEDCENVPLDDEAAAKIAAVAPSETQKPVVAAKAAEPTVVAKPKETQAAPVKQEIIPAAKPKPRELTAALPDVPSEPKKAASSQTTAKTTPSKKALGVDQTRVASLNPSPEVDKKGSADLVGNGTLEIVFATNSSYFPEGAGDQLRAFMKTLDKGKSYVLRIQTSVDGAASVSGASSTNEAERYNAWLAERRFQRVEAWLLKNSDGRKLTLEPSINENDGSRRVRIEANPLG
ncbi:MAG: hypothetical protein OEU92_33815, partial [Alphaproteobacteria bacterium]|nr:hypothetical protein [Alphaproteobacteria bacterium]